MRAPWLLLILLAVAQADSMKDAIALGRTSDQALYDSFNAAYALSVAPPVESAEIITEFRRAVLSVRARVDQGDYVVEPSDLANAVAPYRGLVTFIVKVTLNPLNTFPKPPTYDLYVATGPSTGPIASPSLKRFGIYPMGAVGPGNPLIGIRLEATFPQAEIAGAAKPSLVLTDEHGGVIWQTRIDVTRYR
ncbi:MAG: hypothetical protein ACRD1V_04240 [Vicinamibacterales bacterium]